MCVACNPLMSRPNTIKHKYTIRQRVSWLNPIGQRLYGEIEGFAGSAMYWIRVDDSRPGYYPLTIIQNESELSMVALALAA